MQFRHESSHARDLISALNRVQWLLAAHFYKNNVVEKLT